MGTVKFKRGQVPVTMDAEAWARLDAMTPEQVERNAVEDGDNPPSTGEELQRGMMGRLVRQTREGTGLSQGKFAQKFQINVARLRDWEQGRSLPDSVALAYLRVISKNVKAVEEALAS